MPANGHVTTFAIGKMLIVTAVSIEERHEHRPEFRSHPPLRQMWPSSDFLTPPPPGPLDPATASPQALAYKIREQYVADFRDPHLLVQRLLNKPWSPED
ncbi:MAG: hypothetical protein ACLGIM_21295 [Alphaproteobacteria bacterium]